MLEKKRLDINPGCLLIICFSGVGNGTKIFGELDKAGKNLKIPTLLSGLFELNRGLSLDLKRSYTLKDLLKLNFRRRNRIFFV